LGSGLFPIAGILLFVSFILPAGADAEGSVADFARSVERGAELSYGRIPKIYGERTCRE